MAGTRGSRSEGADEDRVSRARIAFGETADPACYVPRPETERVLDLLEKAARIGSRPGALIAAPGTGKSLLLRVLAERLSDALQVVHLPYGSLTLEELSAWALGILGEPPTQESPCEALRQLAARSGPLVLLIDDASSLPIETARGLGDQVVVGAGALRLVLAAPDDARASRVLAALGIEVAEAHLVRPLSEMETADYMRERARRAGLGPAEIGALLPRSAARIHALSAGVPRRVHELALHWIENDIEHEVASEGEIDSEAGWDIADADLEPDLD